MQIRFAGLAFVAVLTLVPKPVTAQTAPIPCTEKDIRSAIQNHTIKYTDDTFFWSGAFDKPLIGTAATKEASKEVSAERKHEVPVEQPQRIEVSSAGDMAYEYGTGSVSFEEVKTGKHVSFQIAYVRVWKSADGECKAAASMFKPIESTIQTK
jgi:ketosteroid isomerase-like protein